jgi:acyl-coenzyme A synthetase/AMP-(fatty) acid ligase
MPKNDRRSLWSVLRGSTKLQDRFFGDAGGRVSLGELARGSCLGCGSGELFGRSFLIATGDQLTAGLALIELDGIARRLVLCPAGLSPAHILFIVKSASVDAIVSDQAELAGEGFGVGFVTCSPEIRPAACHRTPRHQTEWILLTSGTTGQPKLVVHTLRSLAAGIGEADSLAGGFVWSTFYDIRRYGGLQIFLRALLTGGALVLSNTLESTAAFLSRLGACGVTHISGTPTHWRQALMCPSARNISPQYLRLSGEIADQGILDQLHTFYPEANVAHAFASTEAGLAFDVRDGLAGFPANLIRQTGGDVEIKVEDGSLRIRSSRTAARYIGPQEGSITDVDGFVDTGDMVESRGNRYYFIGRRDGVINVGGLKIHPEEVESVINRHPQVRMSLVRTRKSAITGALVVADVVLYPEPDSATERFGKLQHQILGLCREALPRHKVPAAINFVSELAVSATGKMSRYA